jgi:hypothetical protein
MAREREKACLKDPKTRSGLWDISDIVKLIEEWEAGQEKAAA